MVKEADEVFFPCETPYFFPHFPKYSLKLFYIKTLFFFKNKLFSFIQEFYKAFKQKKVQLLNYIHENMSK